MQQCHYGVADIDQKIEDVYATVALSDSAQRAIRTAIEESLSQQSAVAKKETPRHQRRIQEIEAHQAKLVQMYLKDLASSGHCP